MSRGLSFVPTPQDIEECDQIAREYQNGLFIDWALHRGPFQYCWCSPEFGMEHREDGFHWSLFVTHDARCPATV